MAYTEIDTGDVTGDGLPDIVGFRDGVVDVLARQPDGMFAAAVHYQLVVGYWREASGVAIGDLNGDGRNDVAVSIGGNSPGARINVFAQTTAGTLGPPSVYPAYEVADTLASADMNMDGRTDLLLVHRGWGRLGVFLQRPDGTLSTEQLSEIPSGQDYRPKALAAGDFNGDGVPDVALADADSGLVVLRSAGEVRAWGLGNLGQLGNGSTANTAQASAPLDVTDIVGASAGAYHNLALARDGRVWSWGLNHVGQLGTGSTVDRSTPTLVPGITNAINVTAGPVHSLAIKDDGTVWVWGWNAYGQLGLGSTTDRTAPTRIPGLANVTALAGGAAHSLAVTADGSVWAWGLNHVGQLGTGDTTSSLVPVKVPGLTNVVAVAAGLFHSMALTADGQVWAWGFNDEGEVGTGSEAMYEPVPHMVKSGASAIAAGAFHSIAVAWDGTVWTWGSNQVGQLGDGTTHQRRLPNRIDIWYGIRTVSAGWYHTIAVANNGGTWAWGWNYFGQLGDGTTTTALEAVRVRGVSPSLVTGGVAHSLAITARGE
jgi:alpha-tubulin suppressor-like RCC1 family protein